MSNGKTGGGRYRGLRQGLVVVHFIQMIVAMNVGIVDIMREIVTDTDEVDGAGMY